jgi:post-segregation antitoxin (ccd killing protein)
MPDQDKPKDYDPTEAAEAARRRAEAAAWKERNAEAIKAYSEWVEREGLTLEKLRLF